METTNLVGQIYESIGDPEALAETIGGILRISRSRSAQFGLLDEAGRWLQASVYGADPAALELYLSTFAAEDPRLDFCVEHQGPLFPCQQIIQDNSAFEHSGLVNEVLDKYSSRFALCTVFPTGTQYSVALALMRARRDGQYDETEQRNVAPLLPHLKRAMALHVRLGRLESTLTSLEGLVNRISEPVLLVDSTARLRYANAAGHETLRRAQYVLLRAGRVQPRSLRQERPFMNMLATALSNDQEAVEASTSMRLMDEKGHPAVLFVHPLHGQVTLGLVWGAEAVLFLVPPAAGRPVSTGALKLMFGLTQTEMRLVDNLLRGRNLSEIGEELGVSRETLKSQLRSLFMKTDTRRQGELIALLLSFVTIHLG